MGTSILFIFLDGVGLAPAGPDNPLSRVPMPELHGLLGGPLVIDLAQQESGPTRDRVLFRGLDACLGVAGLPQSATGQTALFTGVNAPALVGGHITAYPTEPLRKLIAEHSFLRRAADGGARVLFANAHSEQFWQMVQDGKRRLGASTLTAMAAGAPIPTIKDLQEGQAVLWDITHEVTGELLGWDLPIVLPEIAGARLARLAEDHDLVFFETFLPDLAGHRRLDPEWLLPRLDAFLGAAVRNRPPGCTVVMSSDHGNVEDAQSKLHTSNPVPLLVVGPHACCFREVRDITGVAPAILKVLSGLGRQGAEKRHRDLPRSVQHA